MTRHLGKVSCTVIFILLLSLQAEAQSPDGAAAQSLSAMQNYRRGRELEALGRMNEANTYYNEAIRICLDEVSRRAATPDTYAAITMTLRRQQKYAEVVSWGERALTFYPNEYRVMEMLGEAFFYLNNYERSLFYMQRYVNAMPEGERTSIAYFFVGEIYRITERNHHADIAYTTALRIDPNNALWWYRLGSVREAVGDRRHAIDAYQRALRLNPNYREARIGLGRLQ